MRKQADIWQFIQIVVACVMVFFLAVWIITNTSQARYTNEVRWRLIYENEEVVVRSNCLAVGGQTILMDDWVLDGKTQQKTLTIKVQAEGAPVSGMISCSTEQGGYVRPSLSVGELSCDADLEAETTLSLTLTEAAPLLERPLTVMIHLSWEATVGKETKSLSADVQCILMPKAEESTEKTTEESSPTEESKSESESAQESESESESAQESESESESAQESESESESAQESESESESAQESESESESAQESESESESVQESESGSESVQESESEQLTELLTGVMLMAAEPEQSEEENDPTGESSSEGESNSEEVNSSEGESSSEGENSSEGESNSEETSNSEEVNSSEGESSSEETNNSEEVNSSEEGSGSEEESGSEGESSSEEVSNSEETSSSAETSSSVQESETTGGIIFANLVQKQTNIISKNAPLFLTISVPEGSTSVVLAMDGGDRSRVGVPKFLKYSTDNGVQYTVMADGGAIKIPCEGSETIRLVLDFYWAEIDWTQMIYECSIWSYKNKTLTGKQSFVVSGLDPSTMLDDRLLNVKVVSEAILSQEQPLALSVMSRLAEVSLEIGLEMLTTEGYIPIDNPESYGLVMTSTVENGVGEIMIAAPNGLAPAGTYRLTVSQIYENIEIEKELCYFFVNYR